MKTKLSRVLIFTFTSPKELDVKLLEELNNRYIKDLYGEEKTSLFKSLFLKKTNNNDTKVIFLETGYGKLRSYKTLYDELEKVYNNKANYIDLKVANLGTCGCDFEELGTLVNCSRFIDADIATLESLENIDKTEWLIESLNIFDVLYSCNSRDKLVTDLDDAFQLRDGWKAVCDTEAFSQAKCCEDWSNIFNTKIKFSSLKFVSNKFNEIALKDYEKTLPKAKEILTEKASKLLYNFYYAKSWTKKN